MLNDRSDHMPRRPVPTRGLGSKVFRLIRAYVSGFYGLFAKDVQTALLHTRLVAGITFVIVGLMSFSSDRYCDGSSSVFAACTRPSTYYYYPWWAVLLVVLGALLLMIEYVQSRDEARRRPIRTKASQI